MATTNEPPEHRGLMGLLGRAVLDKQVRDKLVREPDALAKEYHLSQSETEALKKVDPKAIEDAASQMTSRSEVSISIVVRVKF
jgi:hypothetical protein